MRATTEEVKKIQEQLARTPNDPNLTLTTSFIFHTSCKSDPFVTDRDRAAMERRNNKTRVKEGA